MFAGRGMWRSGMYKDICPDGRYFTLTMVVWLLLVTPMFQSSANSSVGWWIQLFMQAPGLKQMDVLGWYCLTVQLTQCGCSNWVLSLDRKWCVWWFNVPFLDRLANILSRLIFSVFICILSSCHRWCQHQTRWLDKNSLFATTASQSEEQRKLIYVR
jgi:hypothetical protein